MKTFYELKDIEKLLEDFYLVTKRRVGIFGNDFNVICEYPKNCCDFCTTVRTSEKGAELCRKCDLDGMQTASKGSTVTYRCHAGLIEVCAPIKDDMGILGYFMLGQVIYDRDEKEQHTVCKKNASEYFESSEVFEKSFDSLNRISAKELDAIEKIMSACVGYIYLKKLMSASHEGLWGQMDYYIERNFTEDITLEKMAQELNVSISSLCKTSKSKSGMTVNELIAKKRIDRAKQLLRSESMSIGEVSLAVGISDYNYFSRLFKKNTGMTPRKYREK